MNLPNLIRDLKKPAIFFLLFSAAAVIFAVFLFYYAKPDKQIQEVLGEKVSQNANSLFGAGVILVKTAVDSRVYAVINGQKHLIRNEEVFYSYDFSFNNVKTISQAELDKYPEARLVKEEATGRIYYLSYAKNLKKYHPSPEAFNAYPGNKWGNVIEVGKKDLSFWQDAKLLKAVNDNRVYYADGGKKAWIKTESEFNNAGFHWDKILTVFSKDLDAYAEIDFSVNLTKEDNRYKDKQTQIPPNLPAGKGQLIIALDSSSPKASIFPFTTSHNIAAKFKLQAVGDRVAVSGITLTRKGVSQRESIGLISIEDENGVAYGTAANISNENKAEVRFGNKPLTILKDTQKIVVVRINLTEAGTHGGTVSFGISSNNDIKANGDVTGIFPLFGAEHKFVATQNLIGSVKVNSVEINSKSRSVNIGVKKETIAKFKFAEASGNEDVEISSIKFFNRGTAANGALDYIHLYKDGRKHLSSKDMVNGYVFFDMEKTPIVIKKNKELNIEIKVDIAKGENTTLKFVINEPGDIKVKGLSQGFSFLPASDEHFPVGFGSGQEYNQVAIKREGIGVIARRLDEDEREIYRDTINTSLAQFEIRNISENVFLQRLQLKIEKFNSAPDLEANIKIIDKTKAKDPKDITEIDYRRLAGGVVADVGLSNYEVAGGQTMQLDFITDIPETAQSNNAHRVVVQDLSYKIGQSNTIYQHGASIIGPMMLVFAPQITITKAELENKGAGASGDEDVELAAFNVKASADERIKITSITVSLAPGSDDATYSGGFSNLALYAGNRRKSEVINQPNSNTYAFNDLSISVSANKSLDIVIKADTEINTEGKTVIFKIDDLTAQGYASRAPVFVFGEGTLSSPVALNKPEQ